MAHQHKAIADKSEEYSWGTCMTPTECAARPQRQEAHGNITRRDECRCGAVRYSEVNGGRTNYGEWTALQGDFA